MKNEKFYFTLTAKSICFDEKEFTSLEEGKEWAKGRNRHYDHFSGEFRKYTVDIYTYDKNGDPIPYERYFEE